MDRDRQHSNSNEGAKHVSPDDTYAVPQNFDITVIGLAGEDCVKRVEERLLALEGISRAIVDLDSGLARVEHDPNVISRREIEAAIQRAGFEYQSGHAS